MPTVPFFEDPSFWCALLGLSLATQALAATLGPSLWESAKDVRMGRIPVERMTLSGRAAEFVRAVWAVATILGVALFAALVACLSGSMVCAERPDLVMPKHVSYAGLVAFLVWATVVSSCFSIYGYARWRAP